METMRAIEAKEKARAIRVAKQRERERLHNIALANVIGNWISRGNKAIEYAVKRGDYSCRLAFSKIVDRHNNESFEFYAGDTDVWMPVQIHFEEHGYEVKYNTNSYEMEISWEHIN